MSHNMVSNTRALEREAHPTERIAPTGTQYLGPDEPLVLFIEDSNEPLWLEPCRQAVLGRVHPQNPQRPDVDLSPFQGFILGVSTRHVALVRQQSNELMIEDLASRNGTFLNGERLRPHTRYQVHSGDYVRLGNLTMQVNFGG
jgi:hypothetical protein